MTETKTPKEEKQEDEENQIFIEIDGKLVKADPKLTKTGVRGEAPND